MIEKLKTLSVAKYTVEELIELRSQSRLLYSEYDTQKLEKPDWLNNAVNDLDREIAARAHDERARKLSELKARKSQLLTNQEKRDILDAEIASLEKTLVGA
jgi:hypothetical protein